MSLLIRTLTKEILIKNGVKPSKIIANRYVFSQAAQVYWNKNFTLDSSNLDQNELNLPKEAPEGVREEFYELYVEVMKKTQPTLSKLQTPKLSLLNRLLTEIKSIPELKLAPEVIERWRRRQIKFSGLASRFPFHLSEQLRSPDIAFQLLADRHRYGLHPRVREFNKVLNAYSLQVPNPEDSEAIKAWGEKMLMTFGLIPYYNLKPDQETATILLSSLFKSPLADEWFPRLYKIAHELKESGVVMSDEISHILAEMVTKHGRPSYGVPMPSTKD